MPKRRINPVTGEPELTTREQTLVDEFISNGGNGARAAASAGYGAARPDQSAYQVLHRPLKARLRGPPINPIPAGPNHPEQPD